MAAGLTEKCIIHVIYVMVPKTSNIYNIIHIWFSNYCYLYTNILTLPLSLFVDICLCSLYLRPYLFSLLTLSSLLPCLFVLFLSVLSFCLCSLSVFALFLSLLSLISSLCFLCAYPFISFALCFYIISSLYHFIFFTCFIFLSLFSTTCH